MSLAKQGAADALSLSHGRDVEAIAAIALAVAGDSAGATRLGNDLSSRFPQDTVTRYNFLPAIKSAIALHGGQAAPPTAGPDTYEYGQTAEQVNFVLYPVYLRGQAYLAAKQGTEASVEFEKILDHPGLVQNEPIGALAYLGLARAHVLSGELAKAKSAYGEFLALWKGADSDLPILRQAKAEEAKLP
jgi:eukaryotic-like serine/threonine-protein kinase